jgi:hypothetical protein
MCARNLYLYPSEVEHAAGAEDIVNRAVASTRLSIPDVEVARGASDGL